MRSFARKNPSFLLFVALVPGLLLVEASPAGGGLVLELAMAAALAVARRPRHAAALGLIACLLLGRACASREARLAEVAAWRAQAGGPLEVLGRAEARGRGAGGQVSLLFRVERAARPGSALRRRPGWVRLYWREPQARSPGRVGFAPPIGRAIMVRGTFRPAGRPENPGTLDWGLLPGGPRVRGTLTVESWSSTGGSGPPAVQTLRERLSARVECLFPPLSGGFMQATLFGDREGLDPRLREVFSRTGTGHIIAISGMNVAILAALGWAVLAPFVPSPRRRRWLLAAGLLLYVPLGGSSPSVARAAFMGVGILCAQGAARRVLLPNALGAAGITVLLFQPEALLDPSFQLSFLAVLGLALLPDVPREPPPPKPAMAGRAGPASTGRGAGLPGGAAALMSGLARPSGRVARLAARGSGALGRSALGLSSVTLASVAATLPLTLGYFRHLPLAVLPANLLVVPALGALTAGGFAAILASFVWAPLAAVYAQACDLLLWFVFRALEVCARPDWVWVAVPGPRATLAIGGLCTSALAAVAVRFRRWRWGAGAAAGLLLLTALVAGSLPRGPRPLEMATLAVGQGDALALLLPGGEALLVDGGPAEAGAAVAAFLHERGVARLRRVFATHPDGDHVGGLERVLEEVRADSVHDAGQWGAGAPYRRFLEQSYAAGAGYRALVAGERLRFGEVTVDVLWPPSGYAGRDPYWDGFATNDASLVLLIGYRRLRILLPGDAGGEVERRLAETFADSLASGVLKVAHHGSRASSAEEFLRAASAEVALISVGRDNRYGHPHPEALARLAGGTRIWRTDLEGALLLTSDGRGYELRGYASGRVERGRLER